MHDGEAPPDPWTLLARWGLTADNAELIRSASYRFHALVADRWRHGSVFLAGDAAHQMPPFMGQGMCSGVRDAANLAWKLAAVRHGDATDELLDTYERERRPHVEATTRLSIQAGDLLDRLAADPTAAPADVGLVAEPIPEDHRWSRLPGLDLGQAFPVGHQLPQPDRLDDRLPRGWVWVATDDSFVADDDVPVVVEPRATYGRRAVLVRPDRYISAVG
ncbi:MAG: FAD-dependent monooxygenase [Actinobacteria bacterium]|nr:FAD-dependent monooxygenase [Actinomycetota bacterium]